MCKETLRIHFSNGEPNIAEMFEILLKKGFRKMTDATPENLPSGSVALIYNAENHTIVPILVTEHIDFGMSYMVFYQLDNDPDVEFMSRRHYSNKLFYKKLTQIPVIDSNPQLEFLPQAIAETGFVSLNDATPANLPEGCIALIYTDRYILTPVIVRVLSMENRRFLYLHQGIVAGDWHSAVIMDHLKPFKNYSYLVIS